MIQDIFPHVFHNEFQKLTPRPEDLLLAYRDHAVLSALTELRLPSFGDFSGVKARYAFSIDDVRYFLAEAPADADTRWRLLPSSEYRY